MSGPRVLIIAHGHPDFSVGGGELAAYAQWQELRRRGVEAVLIARVGQSPGHSGATFSLRSADGSEVLFNAPPANHFRHSQPQRRIVHGEFRSLLERIKPTVVHFHHYVHLGLEMIREVRKFMPDGLIVATLHEYLAICHARGQMLREDGVLCSRATPLDCHRCFPSHTPQEFFLRELFVKSFLNLCDHFVCPSAFLRDRYVEWGLPGDKMLVLENGQAPRPPGPGADPPEAALRTRFVLMGQLSRLKGTFVLLEAVRLLPRALRKSVRIEIHGSMQFQPIEFKTEFQRGLDGLEDTVYHAGPYRPADAHGIVQGAGWVIVPSLWWENSPMVIQEAFAAGRPVICSNVGGMAEKVADGVSGLHFRVGSASDLAARIEQAATKRGLWERLLQGVPRPPMLPETVDRLLALYRPGRYPSAAPAPAAGTALDPPLDSVANAMRSVRRGSNRTRA